MFIKSPDREIRKQAYLNFWKGFGGVNLTLCHNYIGYVKKCDYLAKMYNFKSALDRKLFYDELDKKVYDKLFVNLHKNYNLYQKYLDKKAKILNLSVTEEVSMEREINMNLTMTSRLNLLWK